MNRYRQRVLDALNGNAGDVDPAVKRALLGLADELETSKAESDRRDEEAKTLARSAVDAVDRLKKSQSGIAIGIAIPILIAAILAALRLT